MTTEHNIILDLMFTYFFVEYEKPHKDNKMLKN